MDLFSWRYSVFSYITSIVIIIFILIADSVFKDMPIFLVERFEITRASYLVYWKEAAYCALGISFLLWLYYRYYSSFQFFLMQRDRQKQHERSEAHNYRYSIHKE